MAADSSSPFSAWFDRGRTWFTDRLVSFLIVIGLLALWQFYSTYVNTVGDIFFPSIDYMLAQTIQYQDLVISGIQTTFTEIVAGYVLSIFFGVTIGIVLSESFVVRQMTMPSVVFAYSLPHAIMAPLFILWFGSGTLGIALFAAWFGFFSVLVNTITGFNSVDEEFHQLCHVVGASEWQKIRKIKIWTAMPHIASGAKIALQQTIIGVIIGEFIATGSGLGHIIVTSTSMNRLGLLFGVLILIMVFAVLLYKVVGLGIDFITPPSPST
jgi:NitT/TauT family transport system permease protein